MVSAPVPPPSHKSGSKKTQGGAGTHYYRKENFVTLGTGK
jgi:hypothetical protein